MKKYLWVFLVAVACTTMFSCYNDDEVWDAIHQTQSELTSLQQLLKAMQQQLTITSVEMTDEGCVVVFSDGTVALIAHGKPGKDGSDGGITVDDSHPDYVIFTLSDGTIIKLERAKEYILKVMTFEGAYWDTLVDEPQYGGVLLYGETGMGDADASYYNWCDEGNTMLAAKLPFNWGSYCFWGGGQAISNYVSGDIQAFGDFNSQLTVYKKGVEGLARCNGGHNGSNHFCVQYGYRDQSGWSADNLPYFYFADGQARVIDHLFVNNTTYALNCYMEGNGMTARIGESDWVKLVAIGFDANGQEVTQKAECYLCNGPSQIVTDWTKWDLSALGAVTRVEFNITGSSDNGYGYSQPAYFAYDDVAVRFPRP